MVTLDTLSAVNIDGDSLKKRESDAKDDEKWGMTLVGCGRARRTTAPEVR